MAVTYASNNFTVTQNAVQTGTGTVTAVPTTVTIGGVSQGAALFAGTGTSFTTQLRVGSLVIVGGNTYCVHSIASNTSMIAYRQNHADPTGTISTAATFTYYVPTLWSELVAQVTTTNNSAVAWTDGSLNIVFRTANLTINANAVLVCDDYSSMSFGAAAGYRINHAANGYLIYRNGGHLTFNGNVSFGWFNGWLNVLNGTLTWQNNSPGGTSRQDFFNNTTTSNGMSSLELISSGGTSGGNWMQFVLFTNLAGKFGSVKMINAIKAASNPAGYGIYLQFQEGTYKNVTFPSTTSTYGVSQNIVGYLSRTAGTVTTLDTPTFPGSSYGFGANLAAGTYTDAYIIDEQWPDLASGTVGSLVASSGLGMNGGGNRLHRRFRWYAGTYSTEGGWNVYLRDSSATPVVAQLGVVTSNAAKLLEWQLVTTQTGQSTVYTDYGPFKLLARKAGYVSRYETFTPTAPRTEAFVPEIDSAYTSDQSSAQIAGNSGTNTLNIGGASQTYDIAYDWFQWWMAQDAQMTAYNSVARVDTVSGSNWSLPTGWTINVTPDCTWAEGTKISYVYSPTINLQSSTSLTSLFNSGGVLQAAGTLRSVTVLGVQTTTTSTGKITGVYGTTVGVSTQLDFVDVSNNAAACIWDYTTGATELYQLNTSGSAATYTLYYPPGSAGTQKNVARELYGYQREGETITLAAGKMWVTYSDVQDVGITQTTQATVAAYTTLETSEKVYDYIAYKRLDANYIKLGQIATRSGTAIDFGTYSGVVKSSATSVIDITGSVITIKANGLAGTTKYNKIIATPPATWVANSTEIIDINIEDGNGDSSVTIEASGVSTFEIWKITDATPPDQYATGTLMATVGIGKWRFLHADGYKFVVRDTTTNFRVVVEAEKGDYEAALYFGADVQLAQAPDVTIIKNNLALMQIDVDAIKGTGFDSTDSLHAISDAVDALPASILAATVETGATVAESLRLHNSVLGGKVSGGGTGVEIFRDLADTKDRLISTNTATGDRTAEVADLT